MFKEALRRRIVVTDVFSTSAERDKETRHDLLIAIVKSSERVLRYDRIRL
jgi:hypothetical protein